MAHIREPFVRETSATEGTSDMVLAGPMYGSIAFSEIPGIVSGDTIDYTIRHGETCEEGTGAWVSTGGDYGTLQRTAVSRSKHANGTVDASKVVFPAGIKTVILTIKAARAAALDGSVRFDIAQSLSEGEGAQARANAPPFASGVALLFRNATAPVGWTKSTTHTNKAIRVVDSNGTGSGGSQSFSNVFGLTSTDAFTLTSSTIPAHTHANFLTDPTHVHSYSIYPNSHAASDGGVNDVNYASTVTNTGAALTGITITNASIGGGSAHAHAIDLRLQYIDVIVCTKD